MYLSLWQVLVEDFVPASAESFHVAVVGMDPQVYLPLYCKILMFAVLLPRDSY